VRFLRRPPLSLLRSSTTTDPDINSTHHDELLWGMTRFFGEDMVDSKTRRFYYSCHPHLEECKHVHFPIRDLAAAWDASKALEFSDRILHKNVSKRVEIIRVQRRLRDAIKCTLHWYQSAVKPTDSDVGIHLNEDTLLEPPTIGHSALLLLGICNSLRLSILVQDEIPRDVVDRLVQGILSMQMENGAFRIEFGKEEFLRGMEFFPGEAMLSLMSIYELSATSCMPGILQESTKNAILPAMERAFRFYSNYYYTEDDVNTNFNIWQIQSFAKCHDSLGFDLTIKKKEEVRNYVIEMCLEICDSRSWKYQLARGQSFYINLETVEIACGLDALAEGIRIVLEQERDLLPDNDAKLFKMKMQAINALYFLEWSQGQVPDGVVVGKGGLGYGGTEVFEQRLDVTGHAISALVKLRNLFVLLP